MEGIFYQSNFNRRVREEAHSRWLRIHDSHPVSRTSKVCYWLASLAIKWFSALNQFDLSGRSGEPTKNADNHGTKYHFNNFQTRNNIWTILFRWIYIILGVLTMVVVYIQLMFGWKRLSLQRLQSSASIKANANYNSTILQLQEDEHFYLEIIKYVGYPFPLIFVELHMTFYLFTGLLTYGCIYQMNKRKPFDLSSFGTIIERDLYLKYYVQVVIGELDKFLASNLSFQWKRLEERKTVKMTLSGSYREEFLRILTNNHKYEQVLKELLLTGNLLPFHRRPESCRYAAVAIVNYIFLPLSLSLWYLADLFYLLASLISKPFQLVDLISYTVFPSYIACSALSAMYILILCSVSTTHMIQYAKHLNKEFDKCIQINDRGLRFQLMKVNLDPQSNRKDAHYEFAISDMQTIGLSGGFVGLEKHHGFTISLDLNLLYILIHLKIFFQLFKQTSSTVGRIALIIILVYLFGVIVITVENELVEERDLLIPGFLAFMLIALLAECLILPICYLNAQTGKLYKNQANLIAHSVAAERYFAGYLESAGFSARPSCLFDKYLLAQITRELDRYSSSRLGSTVVIMDTPLSYATMLRWHLVTILLTIFGFMTRYYRDEYNTDEVPSFVSRLSFL